MNPDIEALTNATLARLQGASTAPHPKTKTPSAPLAHMSTRPHIVCCATAVFLGLLFAYLFRFSITTGSDGTYKLDRWTGDMIYIDANQQLYMRKPSHY